MDYDIVTFYDNRIKDKEKSKFTYKIKRGDTKRLLELIDKHLKYKKTYKMHHRFDILHSESRDECYTDACNECYTESFNELYNEDF
jgi:hypothetical protein